MDTTPDSATAAPLPNKWHAATYDGHADFNHSDLVIICQGHEFKVQKSAVCPQSPVLAAQMHGSWQESRIGKINVEEFDAGTIERLLHYLYFLDYSADASSKDVTPSTSDCSDNNRTLLVHAHITAAADYYQIAALKSLVTHRSQANLDPWSSVGFSEVIHAVYSILEPKDRTLKDAVLNLSMRHWVEVRSANWFEDTLTTCGQFAHDILVAREKIHDTTEVEMKALKPRLAREPSVVANAEFSVPLSAYRATYFSDCGVEYEGLIRIWSVAALRRFSYMTADKKHGTIDPARINKVEWGEASSVRLTGNAREGKVYDVRIIFEDLDDLHSFKADCSR